MPIRLKQKDYSDAIKRFKARVTDNSLSGVSVYILRRKTSEHLSRGFSDLDFLIASDNPGPGLFSIFLAKNNKGMDKYILYHDALFLPKRLAVSFPRIMGGIVRDWMLLWGTKLNFMPQNKPMADMRNLDDLIMHNIRTLLKIIFTKRVGVRAAGHKLNGIKFWVSPQMLGEAPKSYRRSHRRLTAKIGKWRGNYFSASQKQNFDELISILNDTKHFIEQHIKIAKQYYTRHYFAISKKDIIFSGPNYPILFKEAADYVAESESIYNRTGLVIPVFPPSFAGLWIEYSRYKGIVSNHIRKYLSEDTRLLKKEYVHLAKERISYYNEQAVYCLKHGLEYGPLLDFNLCYIPEKLKSRIMKRFRNFMKRYKIRNLLSNS